MNESAEQVSPPEADHDVLVVGAGFSGLAMAIRLKRAGNEDFLVVEQGDSVGGTWRDNTYPGCACDVQSHLYSLSFAPNPEWSRMFAPQGEIREYLERTATEFGVRPHVRLRTTMTAAAYDEEAAIWRIELNGDETLTARVLVSAIGALSKPAYPEIAGLESFGGPSFHSAAWERGIDLEGKRVAVLGTGASAIQIVPQIAPEAARVTLFQRTPPWIIPKRDRRISSLERRLFRRFPAMQRAYRRALYWALEARVIGFSRYPALLRLAQKLSVAHINRQIKDPELRRKVTPDYTLGCKRVLISNDYYPALARDDVEVITDPIARVTERGIVTADGAEHAVDVIVFGTGFQVQQQLADLPIRGRGGRELNQVWVERGMQAHRGTTIAGFPNMFMLLGPNTGVGHTSVLHMLESQVGYVIEALEQMRRRELHAVEVSEAAQEAFNRELQGMQARTVWSSGGCRSWYLDESGRNTALWPDFTYRFRNQLADFDLAEYRPIARAEQASAGHEAAGRAEREPAPPAAAAR